MCVCMIVCAPCACSTTSGHKRVADSPKTGDTSTCMPQCGCWKPNTGPLQEQPVLLTSVPSLQPQTILLAS